MQQARFQLRILGHTEFSGPEPEKADLVLRQSKRLALLAYLALATAEGFKRRDQVTALFWPELEQTQARTYLRKALYAIREALGEDLFIVRGEDEVRVDPARLWCDAVALGLCVREQRWSDALSLYRGELLEGLFPEGVAQEFQEWLSGQRAGLRQHAAHAAWECSRLEEERGDRTAAAVMARRARELDPDNEEGVRRLMGLLDRRGDRGGALRVYTEWQATLAEEFGVEPDPETRKLARRIQAARRGESNESPPMDKPVAPLESSAVAAALVEPIGRSAPPPVERTRSRWVVYGVIGVLVGLSIGAGASLVGPPRQAEGPNSIAVLPLVPIGDSTLRGLAESVTEEMTTALAQDSTLTVRAVRGVREDWRGVDAVRIGRDLGVGYIVVGGVQRGAGKFRITLRLVTTENALTAWARSVEIEAIDTGLAGQRVVSGVTTDISSVVASARQAKANIRPF
jgi:serine/threonine-protein kinase